MHGTVTSGSIHNNHCNTNQTGGCVLANAVTGSNISNNEAWGADATASLFKFTGSSNNSTSGNVCNGTALNCLSYDSSSNNNKYADSGNTLGTAATITHLYTDTPGTNVLQPAITWPASTDVVISNSTNSPTGVTPINGDCLIGSGSAWVAGSCTGGGGAAAPTYTGKRATVGETLTSLASISTGSATLVAGEVWFLACRGGTSSVTSVAFSDSQGNTWTKIGSGIFSANPWIQIAFSKITNAGSATFTCTPSGNSQFMAAIAAGFGWTTTTPSVLGSATGTSASGNYMITGANTSAQSLAYTCGTYGSTGGTVLPVSSLGVPATLTSTSASNLNGNDDMGCEFSNVPYAVTGGAGTTFLHRLILRRWHRVGRDCLLMTHRKQIRADRMTQALRPVVGDGHESPCQFNSLLHGEANGLESKSQCSWGRRLVMAFANLCGESGIFKNVLKRVDREKTVMGPVHVEIEGREAEHRIRNLTDENSCRFERVSNAPKQRNLFRLWNVFENIDQRNRSILSPAKVACNIVNLLGIQAMLTRKLNLPMVEVDSAQLSVSAFAQGVEEKPCSTSDIEDAPLLREKRDNAAVGLRHDRVVVIRKLVQPSIVKRIVHGGILALASLILLVTSVQAQLTAGIIDPSRSPNGGDWSGVGATIPTTWTQCGSTVAAGTSITTVNSLISGCASNTYLLLGPGNFSFSTSINLKSNVIVRGSGANSTFVSFTGGSACHAPFTVNVCAASSDTSYWGGPSNTANWTAGYAPGTTSITLSSTTNLHVGNPLILDQIDDQGTDTDNFWIGCEFPAASTCSYSGTAPSGFQRGGGSSTTIRGQQQVVKVTSISGTTVGITPGIYANNWTSGKSPGAWWATSPILNAGIENISLDATGDGAHQILFFNCQNCWVKGVRSIVTSGTLIFQFRFS